MIHQTGNVFLKCGNKYFICGYLSQMSANTYLIKYAERDLEKMRNKIKITGYDITRIWGNILN